MCVSHSDDKLFLQLYNDYYGKIRAFCSKLLDNRRDLACDCTQNTFLALFQNIEALRTHENHGGWLYKTAKNQVLLAVRQIKRDQLVVRLSDFPSGDGFVTEIEEKLVPLRTNRNDVLFSLSEKERKLHKMFYVDGLRTAEIAVALGISDSACRTRLHRLRQRIYAIVRAKAGE
jgi:RNA polymerase sigma-70 factor (ECF subfamily)